MDEADIRMLKLGYFRFDPGTQHYWREVDRIRGILAGWGELAEKHRVKIVYHTHSGGFMGGNAAALAHLLRGFDPRYIGAYLDPAHMVIEGETFAAGLSMLKEYVCAVGLKDVLVERREAGGHGDLQAVFKPAGQGMVNWSAVFAELKRMRFAGVLSIHGQHAGKAEVIRELKDEADFFRQWVEKE
jgi:sugar phosphate isomerase/epimerase